ncbi:MULTISPECIES: alpha/beta hydrolase [unclassified Streptomyces]|uniref:alpha/beta fold hydrolase n=1 Tax=unclassified Streptomyces TaxID=2593676 RepID=UPI002DDA2567|nr:MULTISPECIES: alpha/beta hydrolase [unclassified Streptomyces]WSB75240.1 alpha/beta hydrolase [Streptomyces sp. NBC_01775]WSS16476.1 alpha/beta hydrolase [Streptomyces sp. NBC_01186]WSS45294.1 alpha/beta hydrolase [Streptomyces sp. NBC_01187]
MAVSTVMSPDGTPIAYERHGEGTPVLVAGGALSAREAGVPLARGLAGLGLCGVVYDRRGRGDSGDTPPYAPAREAEDLAAVAGAVADGGEVYGYGMSSGAFVLLEAARAGAPLSRIVLFEPPFTGAVGQPQSLNHSARLTELNEQGAPGEAVVYFMTEVVGLPPQAVEGARQSPMWDGMVKLAHTLAYDTTLMGDGTLPAATLARVKVPALVLSSDASTPMLQEAARLTAEALPDGAFRSLPGAFHEVPVGDLAPVVRDFVTG